jgi:hypothetical protein
MISNIQQARTTLDRARNKIPDDALETAPLKAVTAAAAEDAKVRDARQLLKARNPEQVRLLAETTKGSLQTIQNARSDAQNEQTEVEPRLKVHGEEGLHEKLDIAETDLERLTAGNKSLCRRAATAKTLFETMRENRLRARRA